ncbi:MAG: hypothetical protein L0L69_11075, partial [Propionibacterium sp.]|nr:hypothetical protein [Propionibacterium sp.]
MWWLLLVDGEARKVLRDRPTRVDCHNSRAEEQIRSGENGHGAAATPFGCQPGSGGDGRVPWVAEATACGFEALSAATRTRT